MFVKYDIVINHLKTHMWNSDAIFFCPNILSVILKPRIFVNRITRDSPRLFSRCRPIFVHRLFLSSNGHWKVFSSIELCRDLFFNKSELKAPIPFLTKRLTELDCDFYCFLQYNNYTCPFQERIICVRK